MVVTGFPSGQHQTVIPFSLHASFFGWFSLLFLLAYSGFALDFWEGEALSQSARWLQHAILLGASVIALARYWSFSRRKPLETLIQALQNLDSQSVRQETGRILPVLKGFRFYALVLAALAGFLACALPLEKRIAALALTDGIWYLMALDWLLAQYRFRRSRAKEKVKEALDDLRSLRRPERLKPLSLKAESPWWSKALIFGGVLIVSGISYARLQHEEHHVVRAQLRGCMSGLLSNEAKRGRILAADSLCSLAVLSRFDIRTEGMGATRRILAQEKAGIDPLHDGSPGNQAWVLSSQGFTRRQR